MPSRVLSISSLTTHIRSLFLSVKDLTGKGSSIAFCMTDFHSPRKSHKERCKPTTPDPERPIIAKLDKLILGSNYWKGILNKLYVNALSANLKGVPLRKPTNKLLRISYNVELSEAKRCSGAPARTGDQIAVIKDNGRVVSATCDHSECGLEKFLPRRLAFTSIEVLDYDTYMSNPKNPYAQRINDLLNVSYELARIDDLERAPGLSDEPVDGPWENMGAMLEDTVRIPAEWRVFTPASDDPVVSIRLEFMPSAWLGIAHGLGDLSPYFGGQTINEAIA